MITCLICEDVLQDIKIDQKEPFFVDLPEEWPEKVKIAPDQDEILLVDFPEEQPGKVKKPPKITPDDRLEAAANRI